MKSKILLGGLILFSFLAVMILNPISNVSEKNCSIKDGIVTDIYEGGVHDIVFKLEDDKRIFYINRGLELGLEIEELKSKLMGNEVVFTYPNYWTPLDWNSTGRHLSKVEFGQEIVFNEL